MDYGNKCTGDSMGHNAGSGNRAVASHVKDLHSASKMSGSVSSSIKPKSLKHAPGAPSSVLKTPRATSRPIDS